MSLQIDILISSWAGFIVGFDVGLKLSIRLSLSARGAIDNDTLFVFAISLSRCHKCLILNILLLLV